MVNEHSTTDIMLLEGDNFSGRTKYLHDQSHIEHSKEHNNMLDAQYLGPDIANFISGLTSTVRDELKIFDKTNDESNFNWVEKFMKIFGLDLLMDHNPFTLSGGEQTLLTVATTMLRNPKLMVIDCALEQLSNTFREQLLNFYREEITSIKQITLADNRLSEFLEHPSYKKSSIDKNDGHKYKIKPDLFTPYLSRAENISIKNMTFSYAKNKAIFDNAEISLTRDNIYVLTGNNGVGKSTLSKLLCGILTPNQGEFCYGKKAFTPSIKPAEICAYHFQNPDLQLFSKSVFEEVELSAKNKSTTNILMLLKAFGLESWKKYHPMDIPFTLRKRLALAVTIAMERPWMIIDEPTLGQDDNNLENIAKILTCQSRQGTGIIIITHSEKLTSQLVKQIVRIDNGKII